MRSIGAIIIITAAAAVVSAQPSDAALRRVIEADAAARIANGRIPDLAAAEHSQRAETYMANRMFPQAREHWRSLIERFPLDSAVPAALFGTARSYMWERQYLTAVEWFEKLTQDHINSKEGREGLAFMGSSFVRAGQNIEAAKVYERYVVMFPDGERIESAHLNLIDAYREAGEPDKARQWVEATAKKFTGKPAEANALQALLRLELFVGDANAAMLAADRLLGLSSLAGSMTSYDEARYLKALALEQLGKRAESEDLYRSLAGDPVSYFGYLAASKLPPERLKKISASYPRAYSDFPVHFRSEVLKHAKANKLDPRFVLAIMKQESSFRPGAKSPAGARGLIQLVYDTALKYRDQAGFPRLQPDDLYTPDTNLAIGTLYLAGLRDEFGGLFEAIAASFNAGEDNAARWLNRTRPKEPGLFAAEIGFAETKNYVFKVMNNYRMYTELYTEELVRR